MSGCSLTEAFPDVTEKSGKIARKEERKKAKSCGGPALSFLKAAEVPEDLDPDRIAKRPDEPPEAMSKWKLKEGFNDSSLIGQKVNDVIGKPKVINQEVPSYFGKGEDSFADFNPSLKDNPGYQIQGAGFGSFDKKGLEKAAGSLPTPVLNDGWKALTPSGAQTSFFDTSYNVRGGGLGSVSSREDSLSKDDKQALLRKLDVLFARLDDLENRKNEYAHTEISLFILSGLFLLFGLETIRKFK